MNECIHSPPCLSCSILHQKLCFFILFYVSFKTINQMNLNLCCGISHTPLNISRTNFAKTMMKSQLWVEILRYLVKKNYPALELIFLAVQLHLKKYGGLYEFCNFSNFAEHEDCTRAISRDVGIARVGVGGWA